MKKEDFFADARRDLNGPLDGLVVVEATTTWAGPMAGCLLADLGATVIKIEHPEGEVLRRLPPFVAGTRLSVLHEVVNRNKQNLSLSLKAAEGRDIFLKICATADVVIENFKPGTMANWGVGYADVKRVKPDIVYISISGFGQFGPNSERAGYDPIAQNFTGWSSLNGGPGTGPTKAPTFLADDFAGTHGAMAALAALRHRDRTGEGQHVDIALVDSLLFQSNGQLTISALGMTTEKWGNQFAMVAPQNVYACTDGHVYTGVLLDSHWRAFCEHSARDDLADLNSLQRIARRDELDGVLSAWCATRTTQAVTDTMNHLGLAVTRVNTFRDAAEDAHVQARDMLQPTELAGGAQAPLTGPAAKFSRTPTSVRHAAPAIGAQSDEILTRLGYSQAEIIALREHKIV